MQWVVDAYVKSDVSSLERVYISDYLNITIFKIIFIKKFNYLSMHDIRFHAKSSPPPHGFLTGEKLQEN